MKEAKIIQIKKNTIIASIKADSMCKTCPSSTSCIIKDCSNKEVEITTPNPQIYKTGDIINIDIDKATSILSLTLAYILPLIILLLTFYGLAFFNLSEINRGAFAILSLIPYYFLLFLNKSIIANKIKVHIRDN